MHTSRCVLDRKGVYWKGVLSWRTEFYAPYGVSLWHTMCVKKHTLKITHAKKVCTFGDKQKPHKKVSLLHTKPV